VITGMVGVMDKIEQYRQHAAECLELAKRAVNDEHRQMLVAISKGWDSLAKLHKARDERPTALATAGE
jgi:hypothetical protein